VWGRAAQVFFGCLLFGWAVLKAISMVRDQEG